MYIEDVYPQTVRPNLLKLLWEEMSESHQVPELFDYPSRVVQRTDGSVVVQSENRSQQGHNAAFGM